MTKKYTNEDKKKELKKLFDKKRKQNFTGRTLRSTKNYKGRVRNLALPKTEFSFEQTLKDYEKRELQKKRYGREPKKNEIEVRSGGVMKKPMRLKTGGFLSTGDDRKDLNIIRSAKNLDDGPASSSSSTSSSSSSGSMKRGGILSRMRNGGNMDKIGASPAERRAITSKKKSDAKKKINKPPKMRDTPPGTQVKGELQKTLDRLEKQKKDAAEFEKTLEKKKRSQTSKFGAFSMGPPRLGVMTGRRGKRVVGGDITKKMNKGGKTKSTVNKAGNYTKPTMRKALFNRIKAGGKGGAPGQWSARKAQMLAKQYKAKGGGYRG